MNLNVLLYRKNAADSDYALLDDGLLRLLVPYKYTQVLRV